MRLLGQACYFWHIGSKLSTWVIRELVAELAPKFGGGAVQDIWEWGNVMMDNIKGNVVKQFQADLLGLGLEATEAVIICPEGQGVKMLGLKIMEPIVVGQCCWTEEVLRVIWIEIA